MRHMKFGDAIDDALATAMARDETVVVLGEDVRMLRKGLFVRFGHERVRDTPISEGAFLGAGVAAAMAGLRPVVELMMIDFIGVAMDALLNHASKVETFSGGTWNAPLVVRAACGGGYGDAGQHEQSLWGWLAHIPGLTVVVPSTPSDAGRLMLSAVMHDGPVVFLEHKLLSADWTEFLSTGGRTTVRLDVPADGSQGPAPDVWEPLPFGRAAIVREGSDITLLSLAVGVHRALQAARSLEGRGVRAEVIDLRSVAPLDRELVVGSVTRTRSMLVIDEDYEGFGLSGELAALVMEAGIAAKYARVCTRSTIPYSVEEEARVLPSVERIQEAATGLLGA